MTGKAVNVTRLNPVQSELILNREGKPFWCMSNALTILETHSDWAGVLGFNELTQRRMILAETALADAKPVPRELADTDYALAVKWFNDNGFPSATQTVVRDAIQVVCKANPFDPLREYIDGLVWDGTPRVDGWLTKYLGVTADEYTQEVGKRW